MGQCVNCENARWKFTEKGMVQHWEPGRCVAHVPDLNKILPGCFKVPHIQREQIWWDSDFPAPCPLWEKVV